MIGNKRQKGFTLFIALVIAATLLLVSTGIANLAVKGSLISSTGKDSQYAFYAADTGIECALYWDVKNPGKDDSAFTAVNSNQPISCSNVSGQNLSLVRGPSGSNYVSTFTITFTPRFNEVYCANVTVTKTPTGTIIESKGYNTCDPNNPRRVERAVRVTY